MLKKSEVQQYSRKIINTKIQKLKKVKISKLFIFDLI